MPKVWTSQYRAADTGTPSPVMERLIEWLPEALPADDDVSSAPRGSHPPHRTQWDAPPAYRFIGGVAVHELSVRCSRRVGCGQLTTLVHGDLRVDNMIFDHADARVLAVLDWELSTL